MTCPGLFVQSRTITPLDQARFQNVRNRDVIRHWHSRGRDAVVDPERNCFEPFIYTWIALNAWAECITNQETDAAWVQDLAQDRGLNEAFFTFLKTLAETSDSAEAFHRFWPIPSVRSWRRKTELDPTSSAVHARARFFRDHEIAFSPQCAIRHFDAGEVLPLDWLHFPPSVYRVRCNLFHGEKNPRDLNDGAIVRASLVTLSRFMDRLGYFA